MCHGDTSLMSQSVFKYPACIRLFKASSLKMWCAPHWVCTIKVKDMSTSRKSVFSLFWCQLMHFRNQNNFPRKWRSATHQLSSFILCDGKARKRDAEGNIGCKLEVFVLQLPCNAKWNWHTMLRWLSPWTDLALRECHCMGGLKLPGNIKGKKHIMLTGTRSLHNLKLCLDMNSYMCCNTVYHLLMLT